MGPPGRGSGTRSQGLMGTEPRFGRWLLGTVIPPCGGACECDGLHRTRKWVNVVVYISQCFFYF